MMSFYMTKRTRHFKFKMSELSLKKTYFKFTLKREIACKIGVVREKEYRDIEMSSVLMLMERV